MIRDGSKSTNTSIHSPYSIHLGFLLADWQKRLLRLRIRVAQICICKEGLFRKSKEDSEQGLTPEQANHTYDEESKMVGYEREVYDLGRNEDAPIAQQGWHVCLSDTPS